MLIEYTHMDNMQPVLLDERHHPILMHCNKGKVGDDVGYGHLGFPLILEHSLNARNVCSIAWDAWWVAFGSYSNGP